MPSTYTESLRLTKQADGENSGTWGQIDNTTYELIEDAIAGVLIQSLTTADSITLSSQNGVVDNSRNMVVKFTGTPTSSIDVIVPAVNKMYLVHCSIGGNETVTFKPTGGVGVPFDAGEKKIVYCDGTDMVEMDFGLSIGEILQVSNNLSDLNSASTARTNLGLGSSAVLDAEVSAGSVVVYTSTSGNVAIPAVDGSLLTQVSIQPATTAVAGIIEIATDQEVSVGTDNTKAISPLALANAQIGVIGSTLATAGYVELEDGTIINWGKTNVGTGSSTNVTLAKTYPTAHLIAVGSQGFTGNISGNMYVLPQSLSQVKVGAGATGGNIFWISVGY